MRLIDKDEILKRKADVYDKNGHLLFAVPTGEIWAAKTVDAIPIEPLSEWLAGYCAPPKYAVDAVGGLKEMADATKRAKAWEFALTSMERSGFLEVRIE